MEYDVVTAEYIIVIQFDFLPSSFQSSLSSGYTMTSRTSEFSVPSSPRVSDHVYFFFFVT